MKDLPNLLPAYPEIALLVGTCLALLWNVFSSRYSREGTLTIVWLSLLSSAMLTATAFSTSTVLTFNALFIDDALSDGLKLFIYGAMAVALLYTQIYFKNRLENLGEYVVLMLFALLGMMIVVSAYHFLSLFIGLELLSLASVALIAFDRENSRATEAAMKYFLFSAIASSFFLYGVSLLYGVVGSSLEFGSIATVLWSAPQESPLLLFLSVLMILMAVTFKFGVMPFHSWVPDIYQGTHPTTLFLVAAIAKLAGFALFVRVFMDVLVVISAEWQWIVLGLGLASVVWGSVAIVRQRNFRRLLGYSAILNMGFVLLALGAGVSDPSISSVSAFLYPYSVALFYLCAYVLMALSAFGFLVLVPGPSARDHAISNLAALSTRAPFMAWGMLILVFSMAGIPPGIGFLAKLSVLQILIADQQFGMVVVVILASLVAAFAYLCVVKVMFFDEATESVEPMEAVPLTGKLVFAVGVALVVYLGLFPDALIKFLDLMMKSIG